VPRLTDGINVLEHRAAVALLKVAEAIEQACYYSEQPIPDVTRRALHKTYRVLKPTAAVYYGDNLPLVWDAPDFKFRKKGQ